MAAAAASSLLFSPPKPSPLFRNRNPSPKSLIRKISASSSSSPSPTDTECPVPFDQQPVNEYAALSSSLPFSWAAADLPLYCSRLVATGAAAALLLGLPVSALGSRTSIAAYDPEVDALRWAVGSTATGILAVTLAVLRMYLGWAYVGNRLLSATVEYEETGWYDGQMWVKTPEVLARDRLLGSFSVKPVLNRVKITLVGLSVALVLYVLLFINLENPENSTKRVEERVVAGVYSDSAARSFEPDAFCGEPDLS